MTTRRWIEYGGQKFDLMAATQQAAIGDLLELHREAGMSVRKIGDVLVELKDMESILDIYDTPERLEVWPAMLFLCKRKAGDRGFTYAQALAVSLVDVQIIIERDDEDDADPKDSAPPTPDEHDAGATTTS